MEPTSGSSAPSPGSDALSLLDVRVRSVVAKRGWKDLSEPQAAAIPPLLAGRHLVLIAPTGSGKTESAMLPVFDRLVREEGPGFRAIYITPLRSLNRDILQRMEWWCRELGITVGVRHGDTPMHERRKQALHPPHLLITTPETLQAIFMGKVLRKHLAHVRHVVVDEIHELAGSKRGAQLSVALERLAVYAGDFQRIGLSATVGNPGDVASFLCGDRPSRVVEIPVTPHLEIGVRYAGEDFAGQARYVGRCIGGKGSSLVFVNTRVTAEALGHQLYETGDVEVHHGSLSKEVRVDAEERFKKGEIHTLICTSSMELGIDIGRVEHVIQFGSPREVSRLVQRVGRAGHQLNTISRGTILTTGFDDTLESMVIARMAKENRVEPVVPHIGAADTLANQVAAMAVEYGEITRAKALAILSRSGCFPDPGLLLDRVCEQMATHRLIRIDGELIRRTGRTRKYLSLNLSMIHDEKKIRVFDMVTRRTVATLDESFVVGWAYTGAVFIAKGQLWRILDMEGDRITVEPAKKAKGELPSWEGEQIPVPFEVAHEVGRLRRERDFSRYPASHRAVGFSQGFLARMDRVKDRIPDDHLITLESSDEGVVVNICGGHKANEALARVLSILLSARHGTTVGIEVGAYRFLLRLPATVGPPQVKEVLLSTDPAHLNGILALALKRTSLFRWKLVQVAKKFGAIDVDADYERFSIYRLLDLFEGTVIQEEAYRELFTRYMDVPGASSILSSIQTGEVSVATGPLTILGREGIFSSRDMIPPPLADQAVLATLRQRLDREEIVLCCAHCRKWHAKTSVARVPDRPRCPTCGAGLIAAVKPYEEDLCTVVLRKKPATEEEKAVQARLLRNANIVLSSGKKAVIALAGRGVGPEIASRILATMTEGDAFYREILKAERNFIRTHRFW
ncbi:MAG TPA: DEAD/DEAH box helicase [Methanomicrobiales archaeon]|nr:DEAD/DEAH box helicase [Methanomicrobiales archaeon]